jgi:hypothetical protein
MAGLAANFRQAAQACLPGHPRLSSEKGVDARHKVYTWAGQRPDPSAGHDKAGGLSAEIPLFLTGRSEAVINPPTARAEARALS